MSTERVEYGNWAVDAAGNVVGGTAVEVRNLYDNSLATIYATDTGGDTKANPFTADEDGAYVLFMDPGAYRITVGTSPTDSSHSVYLVPAPNLFSTRAAAELAIDAGFKLPDNTVFRAGDEAYLWNGGTSIPDMPGAAPYVTDFSADCQPEHFGDVTTELRTATQAATDYAIALGSGLLGRGGVVGLGSKLYTVDSLNERGNFVEADGTVGIQGRGRNISQVTCDFETGNLFYFGKGDATILADTTGSDTVADAFVRGLYMENTYYDSGPPTAGAAVYADRASVEMVDCQVRGFYRGYVSAGSPEGCRVQNNDITLGTNNGATGWATAEVDSAAIAVIRREVNSTFASGNINAPQDAADSKYYCYTNSIYISRNNVRCGALAAQRGAEYALLVEGVDGLYASNNHLAWGRVASVGFGYRQTNAVYNNIAFSADLWDPLPTESSHGGLVADIWGIGSAPTAPQKAIVVSGGHIGGAVLDLFSIQCGLTRSAIVGVELKAAGRNGILASSSGIKGVTVGFCSIYNTDTDADGDFDAAINVTACGGLTILGNSIGLGSRGVQAAAAAAGLSIVNNFFYDLSYSAVTRDAIFLATGAAPKRITGNIGTMSTSITAAPTVYMPVGDDVFDIVGTTPITAAQVSSPTSFYPGRVFTWRLPSGGRINSGAIGSTTAGQFVMRDGFDCRSIDGDTITFLVDDNNVAREIGRSGLTVNQVVIADDDFVAIPLPVDVGYLTVTAAASPNACALIRFRAGSGVENVTTIQSGTITDVVTTSLDGTTGDDVHMTVGINDSTLYIENRLGASVVVNYKLIG